MDLLIQLTSNQTDASLAMTRHVSFGAISNNSNLVFSPLSLYVVVSLIAAGSSGPTLQELLSYLNSNSVDHLNNLSSEILSVVFADSSPSGGPKLFLANSVWIQENLPLKPSFQYVLESFYKAASYHVDFQTKAEEIIAEVNSWGEKQTNGLIKNVLPPDSVDKSTRLILANALYFKGEWEKKFDPSRTQEHDFHLLGGNNSVKVPFMTSYEDQYISAEDGFTVLRLPYKKGEDERQFSMYIYLPHSKDGLPTLLDILGSETGFVDRYLPRMKVSVIEFRIPKFKIEFQFEASETMKEMGASLAFTTGGLTEMVVGENLSVSEIYHKALIEVNEEGTEVAAVTGGSTFDCYIPPVDFVADHPFMFLIREDTTGALLFIGHVLNPLQGDDYSEE